MTRPAGLIILLVACSLLACEKNMDTPQWNDELLIGSWFNPQYQDSIVFFDRSEGLVENEYSFTFQEDNTCIERKNAGWCGTPPISYADFDGTWTRNDSLVEISVGFWGGTIDLRWEILALEETILKIKRLEETYHYLEEY